MGQNPNLLEPQQRLSKKGWKAQFQVMGSLVGSSLERRAFHFFWREWCRVASGRGRGLINMYRRKGVGGTGWSFIIIEQGNIFCAQLALQRQSGSHQFSQTVGDFLGVGWFFLTDYIALGWFPLLLASKLSPKVLAIESSEVAYSNVQSFAEVLRKPHFEVGDVVWIELGEKEIYNKIKVI